MVAAGANRQPRGKTEQVLVVSRGKAVAGSYAGRQGGRQAGRRRCWCRTWCQRRHACWQCRHCGHTALPRTPAPTAAWCYDFRVCATSALLAPLLLRRARRPTPHRSAGMSILATVCTSSLIFLSSRSCRVATDAREHVRYFTRDKKAKMWHGRRHGTHAHMAGNTSTGGVERGAGQMGSAEVAGQVQTVLAGCNELPPPARACTCLLALSEHPNDLPSASSNPPTHPHLLKTHAAPAC